MPIERRANIYTDRPQLVMPDLATRGQFFALAPSDMLYVPFASASQIALFTNQHRWRKMRRATHEALNKRVIHEYRDLQQREAASLALQLIRDPENWVRHIDRYRLTTS